MTAVGTDPVDAALSALRGPACYRDNVFRLTGVPVTATAADIRRHHDEFRLNVELGLPVDRPDDPAGEPEPGPGAVDRAFDRLRDPVLRLVHGVLWFWAPGGAEDGLTAEHDAVVRWHRVVLARSRPGGSPVGEWPGVLAAWAGLCGRSDLWSTVRERAGAFADGRIDERTVERLRTRLPVHLLGTLAGTVDGPDADGDGARRVVEILHGSPFAARDVLAALEEQADRTNAPLDAAVTRAEAAIRTGGPSGADAAAVLLGAAGPALALLTTLLGAEHPRRTARHDRVAGVVLRLCEQHVGAHGRGGPSLVAIRSPLAQALRYAVDHRLRERLETDLRYVESQVGPAAEPPTGPREQAPSGTDASSAGAGGTAAEREAERRAEERRTWDERLEARRRRIEERRRGQPADRRPPGRAADRDRDHREAAAVASADQERARAADEARRAEQRDAEQRRAEQARPAEPGVPEEPRAERERPPGAGHDLARRRLASVRALLGDGSVERAGRLLRLWGRRTTEQNDRDLVASILCVPRELAYPVSGVRAWTGTVAGCGLAVGARRPGDRSGARVVAVTVFGAPVLPVRGVLIDGRGVQAVIPMPPGSVRARRLVSTGAASGVTGLSVALADAPATGLVGAAAVAVVGALCWATTWLRDEWWWRRGP